MTRRRRSPAPGEALGRYPRTARVNELCREIVAEEVERLDDDRLDLVTITHVRVAPDLRSAVVEFSRLGEEEEAAAEGLAQHRVRLQAAIARQARLRRTPELSFRVDEVIRTGARIERLLRAEGPGHESPEAETRGPEGPGSEGPRPGAPGT